MTYVSLLRGINVAGKNKIKMTDLKAGYEALGLPNGYGKSKLSNVFIEKKLRVRATTRNWKTVLKLVEF